MSVTDTAFSGSISATTVVIGPTVRVTYDPTHYTNFTASVNGSLNITTTGTQVSTSAMLNVTNGTQSTATNNGAVVVTGGIGLSGNINALGSATFDTLALSTPAYKSMPLPIYNSMVDPYGTLNPFTLSTNAAVLMYHVTYGAWLYEFFRNSTKSVGTSFMIPHDYLQGTPIYIKLAFGHSAGGATPLNIVSWSFQGRVVSGTDGALWPTAITASATKSATFTSGCVYIVYLTIPATELLINRSIIGSLSRSDSSAAPSFLLFSASVIYASVRLGREGV